MGYSRQKTGGSASQHLLAFFLRQSIANDNRNHDCPVLRGSLWIHVCHWNDLPSNWPHFINLSMLFLSWELCQGWGEGEEALLGRLLSFMSTAFRKGASSPSLRPWVQSLSRESGFNRSLTWFSVTRRPAQRQTQLLLFLPAVVFTTSSTGLSPRIQKTIIPGAGYSG